MKDIYSELEPICGDLAHQIINILMSMSREQLIEFSHSLSVIHKYLISSKEDIDHGNQPSRYENVLSPDEINEILVKLEALKE